MEYIGQTRGWFYTMHILATALFDRPAFSNCISHGIVLGSDGQKMSKSLRNYPDVYEVFDRDGADAMRWFLMSSPILRGGNLIVTEQAIRDGVRQVLIPLWNAWYFFSLYANVARGGAGYDARRSTAARRTCWTATSWPRPDEFVGHDDGRAGRVEHRGRLRCDPELPGGAVQLVHPPLPGPLLGRENPRCPQAAFDTLFTVLETTTRVVAPLLPLTAEEIWRGLTGGRSVHLRTGRTLGPRRTTSDLVTAMDRVRDVCSTGSALRKAEGLRVRLPLARLTVVADDARRCGPSRS